MRILLLLLILWGCQPTAPTNPVTEEMPTEPFVGLTARLREGISSQPSALDLELTLPLGWIDEPIESVGLTFRNEEFRDLEGGYTAFIMQHVQNAGFQPWPTLFEAKGDVLRVQYRMLLKHHEADPAVGVDEVPHPVANGWFLNGRAFVPTITLHRDGMHKYIELPIRFTLTGEKKHKIVSSVDPVLYQSTHEYRSETTAGLRDALYIVGQPSLASFTASGVNITIASSDFAGEDFTPLQKLIARALSGGESLLGRPNKERLLLIYDRGSKRAGGVVGDGMSLLYSALPSEKARSDVGVVVVHELVHLWNQADEEWLNEGFTRYAEALWTAKLDGLSPVDAWNIVALSAASYQEAELESTLRKAQNKLAYQGGASMFLCLDASLRGEGLSLWKIWQEARSSTPKDKRMKAETFLRVLQKSSASSALLAEEWLSAEVHQDTTTCFEKLGLRYDTTTKKVSAFKKEVAAIFP